MIHFVIVLIGANILRNSILDINVIIKLRYHSVQNFAKNREYIIEARLFV